MLNLMDKAGGGLAEAAMPSNVKLQMSPVAADDSEVFRAAFDRHTTAYTDQVPPTPKDETVGDGPTGKLSTLSTEFQKDQQYVSKLLESATRSGDSMQLMRAMLSLHDYQLRVQVMSKTVTKVTGAVDQLTKMQ